MKRENGRTCAGLGMWLVILLLGGRAWAAHTYWQRDPASPGDWFVPANWTDGLPTGDDIAGVDNGGTVQIAAGLAEAYKLYLGISDAGAGTIELSGGDIASSSLCIGYGGTGHFIQTSGTNTIRGELKLAYLKGSSGTYELRGGQLWSGDRQYLRYGALFIQTGGVNTTADALALGSQARYELSGGKLRARGESINGLFAQTGGTNAVTGSLKLASWQGFNGTYELRDGRVQSLRQHIGDGGTGHFIQTGGVNEVEDRLYLGDGLSGQGTYELRGGRVQSHTQYVGYSGAGHFIQTGGINAVSETLWLGWGFFEPTAQGTYELHGGRLRSAAQRIGGHGTGHFIQTGGINTAEGGLSLGSSEGGSGTYELSGGRVRSEGQRIGSHGTGLFIQTAGTNAVAGTIHLARWQGSHGTYELSGGRLRSAAQRIGSRGTGSFAQTGGTNKVGDVLLLGIYEGSSGTYTISGGSLSTGGLSVGLGGIGALNITGASADITVSEYLAFGPDSAFSAVAGSTIHMTGSAFRNASTDPAALGGLANLRLIFKGGGGGFNPVEVAGEDMGPVPAGWTDNFALGTLQLGGAGRIRLVDGTDNQQDGPGNEALYVDCLLLNPGAKIDLNALSLYFLNGGLPKQLLAGDANLDGCVDGIDYVTWSNNYGRGGKAWKDGDCNGDTVVDGLDYIAWSGNYLLGEPGGAGQPIPEPGAVALILAGACLIPPRRRA